MDNTTLHAYYKKLPKGISPLDDYLFIRNEHSILVGCGWYEHSYDGSSIGRDFHIYTPEEYRGRGSGRRLLKEFKESKEAAKAFGHEHKLSTTIAAQDEESEIAMKNLLISENFVPVTFSCNCDEVPRYRNTKEIWVSI